MSTLRDHLQAIRDERGSLTAALIVDAARSPEHPLHSRFEWDDSTAAEKWRLEQASQLLRVVKLPPDPTRPGDLRAFVAIKGTDTHRAEYVPTEEAMADPFLSRLVLSSMNREWRVMKKRYGHMAEFAELILTDLKEAVS